MDTTERLVNQYLLTQSIGNVVYEPDGNVPPDFSVNGKIAVEVRRLNQNYQRPDGSTEGLEEQAVPLWQRMQKFLVALGPSVDGESWYVHIRYRRPISRWKPLQIMIKQALLAFMASGERSRTKLQIAKNFTLELVRSGKDQGSFFLLGGGSDYDSGGWVMSEVEKNLRLCIAEKERKIEPYRNRYTEWWLVLSDHIDYSMDLQDRELFRKDVMPRIKHTFDKIVLIDPRDHQRTFEVPCNST